MDKIDAVRAMAPDDESVVDYDRRNLALYAALLEADDAGHPWQKAASVVLRVDPGVQGAEACWRSHLERARWIVGDGLGNAITVLGRAGVTLGSS